MESFYCSLHVADSFTVCVACDKVGEGLTAGA